MNNHQVTLMKNVNEKRQYNSLQMRTVWTCKTKGLSPLLTLIFDLNQSGRA
jgi:hypothetical protein